ncbi:MAG: YceI family protein [Gallionellaceae bacterium]|nr:YceI family protein [Gallionellaceae bacterium]
MNRNIANAVAAALIGLLATPVSATDNYTVDPRHTFPVFEVNHLSFSTQRGRFNKTTGKISLDIAAKKGSVEITIDTASLDMGADDWNKHMKSEDFFNVEKFPSMRFTSHQLLFDDGKPVAAEGEFTLLGITRPLRLTVNNFRCAPHPMNKKPTCGADIAATLKRSDFGMTKYVPGVSDEVRIIAPIEALKD